MPKTDRKPQVRSPLAVEVQPELVHRPIEPDWKSFFENFRTLHGVWPIVDGGRLLFPDGWSCAADSYAGPYLPPPEHPDEVIAVQKRYWSRRHHIVKTQRELLEKELNRLRDLQRGLPGELTVYGFATDDESNPMRVPGQPLPWEQKFERLKWLILDEKQCRNELTKLGVRV